MQRLKNIAGMFFKKEEPKRGHFTVYVWGGRTARDCGHTSMELRADMQITYLSLWPVKSPDQKGNIAYRAINSNYKNDLKAANKEPDGIFQFDLTDEQARRMGKHMYEVFQKIRSGQIMFTDFNLCPVENLSPDSPIKNFNCSGLIRSIIEECGLPVVFHEDRQQSVPNSIARDMRSTAGVQTLKYDARIFDMLTSRM